MVKGRINFEEEYYCGKCGKKCSEDETKYRVFLGVKIPIPPRADGKVGCPNCGAILRQIPRNTHKVNVKRI